MERKTSDQKINLHLKETHNKMSDAIKDKGKVATKRISAGVGNSVKVSSLCATSKINEHIEGGEYIDATIITTRDVGRPVRYTAKKSASEIKRISQKLKVKNQGEKLTKRKLINPVKKSVKHKAKRTTIKVVKETSKEITKETTKIGAKVATKIGTTTAGSAAGPYGIAIGYAVGEGVSVGINKVDEKVTRSTRIWKFMLDKLKPQEEQKDNIFKVVKDLIITRTKFLMINVVKYIGPLLLPIVIMVISVAAIVMAIVAVLYNSPLALFLPPLEAGDTVQTVTSSYMAEFNREIDDLITKHENADEGRRIYVSYEGTASSPNNYYDIMCVYMVKHGYENVAITMNEQNKENLKIVFDDMCSYSTKISEEEIREGKKIKKVKYLDVDIVLKNYSDMEIEYNFSAEQKDMLATLMKAYFSSSNSTGEITNARRELSETEIKTITDKVSDEESKKAVYFALTKVGFPYSQTKRDSGDYFDCSSLAYYSWMEAGINISYEESYCAAAEAQWCDTNYKTVTEDDIRPGDLIFYSFTQNGRYKNISHVGIYVGDGKMVEAVDEKTGVVICDYHNANMVMIGRPNKKDSK